MELKYEWKMKSFGKEIDPDAAIMEINKAANLFGKITAENVLKVASDENSVIHKLFEWDDSEAAHRYRISQARTIINNIEVRVISDNETRCIPVFEIVNEGKGQQYKHIEAMTTDERLYVISSTINLIRNLKIKLNVYNDFDSIVKHLDSAIDELESKQL